MTIPCLGQTALSLTKQRRLPLQRPELVVLVTALVATWNKTTMVVHSCRKIGCIPILLVLSSLSSKKALQKS
jgi:hypothetical protein